MPSLVVWIGVLLLIFFIVLCGTGKDPRARAKASSAQEPLQAMPFERPSRLRAVGVTVVFAGLACDALLNSSAGKLVGVLGASGVLVDYFVLRKRRRKRFLRDLADKEFRVCMKCLYPLIGHGDAGRCPECGAEFNYVALRKEWKRSFPAEPEFEAARQGR